MTHDDPDMVEGPSSRGALAARLARSAPATLLYGAIVAAMAMALAAAHAQVAWRVVIGTSIALLVYWVAHVYVHTIGERLAEPGLSLPRRAAESIHDEAPLLVGGLPTIAVFVLLTLFGVDISSAAYGALLCTAALLAAVGYLAGYTAGIRGWRLVAESVVSGSFGLSAVLLKAWLH